MTDKQLKNFAKGYSEVDFNKIKFNWNGKHGDDFHDPNMDFRIQLCEFLKDDFSFATDQLIIDLFSELSECAGEAWEVYSHYDLLATELLERGGANYFDAYLKGAMTCFDTALGSSPVNLSKVRVVEILNHITTRLEQGQDAQASEGYEYMLKRFKWLAEN